MRHVNTWGYLGLQIFCGLPFIYELRAVLDWSCTPTTLKLFDWLKLEDISTSLYFVTCDRYGREGRRLGQRQPRYMKFCQVMFNTSERFGDDKLMSFQYHLDCPHAPALLLQADASHSPALHLTRVWGSNPKPICLPCI